MLKIDVVIKTMFNCRANGHLGLWPQLLEGMPQKMRTRVTNDLQTIFIFRSKDHEVCVFRD